MGIVAFCPQGHRVKVKAELGGRKGICPQCGTRFRIPRESQSNPAAAAGPVRPSAAGPVGAAAAAPAGLPVARIVSLDGDLAASLPRALPLAAGRGGDAVG